MTPWSPPSSLKLHFTAFLVSLAFFKQFLDVSFLTTSYSLQTTKVQLILRTCSLISDEIIQYFNMALDCPSITPTIAGKQNERSVLTGCILTRRKLATFHIKWKCLLSVNPVPCSQFVCCLLGMQDMHIFDSFSLRDRNYWSPQLFKVGNTFALVFAKTLFFVLCMYCNDFWLFITIPSLHIHHQDAYVK